MTYSESIRKCAINSYLSKKTNFSKTLDIFGISRSTLYNWIKNATKVPTIRHSKITTDIKNYIKTHVIANKNFIMKQLLQKITETFNVIVAKSSVYNIPVPISFGQIYGNQLEIKYRRLLLLI